MKQLWIDQRKFIFENYANKGVEFCAKHLNLTNVQITKRAHYLGLKLDKYDYLNDFLSFTPESVYTIGFICGDGHIASNNYSITIEFKTEDAEDIDKTLMFTPWKKYYRQRESTWKPTTTYYIGDKELHSWFTKFGFIEKSFVTPSVIHEIPKNLLHYFLLGLFDADGCVQAKKIYNKRYGTLQISASKNFDWSTLKDVFESEIGVSFKKTSTNHASCIHLYNKSDIFKFYDYIYKDYNTNKIGFSRKHDKFDEID